MDTHDEPGYLRIGELSRRTGLSPEVLRAWERRYGLLAPSRSTGGFRLYGAGDLTRVQRMRSLLDAGLSAAEAARFVLREAPVQASAEPVRVAPPTLEHQRAALMQALVDYEDAEAHAILDELFGSLPLNTVISEVVLPFLFELGKRWEVGEVTVAQEHHASTLVRGRLLALARGWGAGAGQLALLACLPGEQHDIGLICFGLALRGQGWRVAYVGPDTPLGTLAHAADQLRPAIVVLSAVDAARLDPVREQLAEIAARHLLAVAGAGSGPVIARAVGAYHMDGDPVSAAASVAARWGLRRPGSRA